MGHDDRGKVKLSMRVVDPQDGRRPRKDAERAEAAATAESRSPTWTLS